MTEAGRKNFNYFLFFYFYFCLLSAVVISIVLPLYSLKVLDSKDFGNVFEMKVREGGRKNPASLIVIGVLLVVLSN